MLKNAQTLFLIILAAASCSAYEMLEGIPINF